MGDFKDTSRVIRLSYLQVARGRVSRNDLAETLSLYDKLTSFGKIPTSFNNLFLLAKNDRSRSSRAVPPAHLKGIYRLAVAGKYAGVNSDMTALCHCSTTWYLHICIMKTLLLSTTLSSFTLTMFSSIVPALSSSLKSDDLQVRPYENVSAIEEASIDRRNLLSGTELHSRSLAERGTPKRASGGINWKRHRGKAYVRFLLAKTVKHPKMYSDNIKVIALSDVSNHDLFQRSRLAPCCRLKNCGLISATHSEQIGKQK